MTYQELRDKVLEGYSYSFATGENTEETRKIKVMTGSGGAIMFIDACERQDVLPADIVASIIMCNTEMGTYPLSQLIVNKKDGNEI